MHNITKRLVETFKPGTTEVFLWDAELKGFGVRIKPSGVRTYLVQYRTKAGGTRRYALGRHGPLTAEEARRRAKGKLGEVADGKDPSRLRKASRTGETVADLCKRYMAVHAEAKKKARSIDQDRRMIDRFIEPELGMRKITEVDRADVLKLHHRLRDTPYQANRVLALLSKMFNLAERWGDRKDASNPCRHVEKFDEAKRERFLSAVELALLGDVLIEAERTNAELSAVVAAIRLLIFTGCRLSEVLTLEWTWVDFEERCIRLPDSKSGAKVVHLNAPALQVLSDIERIDGNPFVIIGREEGRHLVNLEKPWRRIRDQVTFRIWRDSADPKVKTLLIRLARESGDSLTVAECRKAAKPAKIVLPIGLSDVRLHDLRHTHASVAAGLGEGLVMIGKLLGHTQAATTHRYAHLAVDPVRAASEKIGGALAGMMAGNATKVVRLR